jgi:two-component system alkaline phosphatase synthesis response regulator PhoP
MQQMPFSQSLIIADNDRNMRDLLRGALDRPWRALFFAANGVEAVQYAQSITADLVLLDLDMPQLDGIDACARIRKLPPYGNVPIMFLTAFHGEIQRRKATRAGATHFMSKPFTLNKLAQHIGALLPDIAVA